MELATQRVWDYKGDNYVHRLIQNKVDGKLVELPEAHGAGREMDPAAKEVQQRANAPKHNMEYSIDLIEARGVPRLLSSRNVNSK